MNINNYSSIVCVCRVCVCLRSIIQGTVKTTTSVSAMRPSGWLCVTCWKERSPVLKLCGETWTLNWTDCCSVFFFVLFAPAGGGTKKPTRAGDKLKKSFYMHYQYITTIMLHWACSTPNTPCLTRRLPSAGLCSNDSMSLTKNNYFLDTIFSLIFFFWPLVFS